MGVVATITETWIARHSSSCRCWNETELYFDRKRHKTTIVPTQEDYKKVPVYGVVQGGPNDECEWDEIILFLAYTLHITLYT